MRGYPKNIATRADMDFLLADPGFKAQALAELKKVVDLADDTVKKVISYKTDAAGQRIDVVTVDVPAPSPKWKQLGFALRKDASDLHAASVAAVVEGENEEPIIEEPIVKGGV